MFSGGLVFVLSKHVISINKLPRERVHFLGEEGTGAPYVASLRKTKESGIWLLVRPCLSFEFERDETRSIWKQQRGEQSFGGGENRKVARP